VLLAPLPADAVVRRQPVGTPEVLAMPEGEAIAGWEQLSVELSAGADGLRHVLIVLDESGRPISAGDSVLYCAGRDIRHENIGGRLEADGTFRGTRWTSIGVATEDEDVEPELQSTPTQPTPEEVDGMRVLVADLMRRLI
jgi:hypothetical protein